MKIGGEYRLEQIGIRQWHKLARALRIDAEASIARLRGMAAEFPDLANVERKRAHEQGLDVAVIDRLAAR